MVIKGIQNMNTGDFELFINEKKDGVVELMCKTYEKKVNCLELIEAEKIKENGLYRQFKIILGEKELFVIKNKDTLKVLSTEDTLEKSKKAWGKINPLLTFPSYDECPHCYEESESYYFGVKECPHCKKSMVICSACLFPDNCANCILIKQTEELNEYQ